MAVAFYSQDCDYLPKRRTKISGWIKEVIANEGFRVGEIAFVFCSPEYHIDINRKYLGHDYHTDVITFDYSDLGSSKIVSGDVLVDPAKVRSQAADFSVDFEEEELRILVHGILHLCGYKDKLENEQKIMRSKEDYYLSKFLEKFGKY